MPNDFMVEAEIVRNSIVIKHCIYSEPNIDPETVCKRLEFYILGEQLNISGECEIRTRRIDRPSTL